MILKVALQSCDKQKSFFDFWLVSTTIEKTSEFCSVKFVKTGLLSSWISDLNLLNVVNLVAVWMLLQYKRYGLAALP